MKIIVNHNETPFERMKRQAFEWLAKKPTAPPIIHLALEKLQSTEPINCKHETTITRFDILQCEECGKPMSDEDVDDLEDNDTTREIT